MRGFRNLAVLCAMILTLAGCSNDGGSGKAADAGTSPDLGDTSASQDSGTDAAASDTEPPDALAQDLPVQDPGAEDATPGDTQPPQDLGADSDVAPGVETHVPCDQQAPLCTFGCGGDAFASPTCGGATWICPAGTTPMDQCPPNSCFGLPFPGESCGPEGWQCTPDGSAYGMCPDVMCILCKGTTWPQTQAGCTCVCDEGEDVVRCYQEEPECKGAASSDLPGVSIKFSTSKCSWTLAEAAAGIEVPYDIVIGEDVPNVVPIPGDAGQCDQPNDSGLIPFEMLKGGSQSYCICDSGLCQGPSETPVTLKAGTYSDAFVWDGRNWSGPSDTGFKKGKPFPVGTYELKVRLKGRRTTTSPPESFEVVATFPVVLTP